MVIKTYDFVGESAYINSICDVIHNELYFLHDDDYAYDMAINEAVLNAAQNSVDGSDGAKIHIEIRITDYDVTTKISCNTVPRDMFAYREQLLAVSNKPEFFNSDWTEYTADFPEASRGIWFMLYGTEYIYMDRQAQSVRLCTRNPIVRKNATKKMRDLLMRFFIEQDEVLL